MRGKGKRERGGEERRGRRGREKEGEKREEGEGEGRKRREEEEEKREGGEEVREKKFFISHFSSSLPQRPGIALICIPPFLLPFPSLSPLGHPSSTPPLPSEWVDRVGHEL
jgi:hypothetical protein